MPTNLNALLRYKTIDRCLTNKFNRCTIDLLISKCSESLSELHGINTSVSERTIRNDIRILRSDVLDFNAPIIYEDGYYRYDDDNYSIFGKAIIDLELLIDIQNLLVEEYDIIKSKYKQALLMKLSEITKEKIPKKCIDDSLHILPFKIKFDGKEEISLSKYSEYPKTYRLKRNLLGKYKTVDLKTKEFFSWEFVFEIL